ncbi:hypothetical protein HKD37_16G045801 [Glycine soja]
MAIVAGRLEKMLSWTWRTSRAASALEIATMWRNPMRRCKTPPYCFAKLARPLCVSWFMMFMLPIRGRPFGPGGYGAVFLRIRDTMPSSNRVNGIVNSSVSRNGSSAVFSSRSKSMVWDFFWFSC